MAESKKTKNDNSLWSKFSLILDRTELTFKKIAAIILAIVALFLAIYKLMDTLKEGEDRISSAKTYTVFLVDMSSSMKAPYSTGESDQKWSKIKSLLFLIEPLLDKEEKVALVGFSGDCETLDDPTNVLVDFGSKNIADFEEKIVASNPDEFQGDATLQRAILKTIAFVSKKKKEGDVVNIRLYSSSVAACERDPRLLQDIKERIASENISLELELVGLNPDNEGGFDSLAVALDGQFINAKKAKEFDDLILFENYPSVKKLEIAESYKRRGSLFALGLFEKLRHDEDDGIKSQAFKHVGDILKSVHLKEYAKALENYQNAERLGSTAATDSIKSMKQKGLID